MSKATMQVGGSQKAGDQLKVTFNLMSAKAAALLQPRERNAVLAEGARSMGLRWIVKWLPLRFTNYVKTFGYRVSAKYQKIKERLMENPLPLIGPYSGGFFKKKGITYRGQPLHQTKDKATVRGVAPGGRPAAYVRIPAAHPLAAIVPKTLRTIPEKEKDDLAVGFRETVIQYLNTGTIVNAKSGRASLNPAARRSLNVGRKTAGSKAKASRGRKVG